MGGEKGDDARSKKRREVAEELLRDVPAGTELPKTKSRWIAADEAKPDPRSVY
jgi:hypothetical protein